MACCPATLGTCGWATATLDPERTGYFPSSLALRFMHVYSTEGDHSAHHVHTGQQRSDYTNPVFQCLLNSSGGYSSASEYLNAP